MSPSNSPSLCPSQILPDLTGEFVDDGALLLLQLLGSGAYGKVYKALDTASQPGARTYYAVKCMPRYVPDSREARIQENELMLHKMVSAHSGVITLHRKFTTPDLVFVVLDLADGDLFNALMERQCYKEDPARIKQAFGEILSAVEFCHRNSVFHRDLKLENILLNSAGTDVRLADFGLATQIGVSKEFGCGSQSYMSPESLIRGSSARACYSARHSDIWALSVIFTNMISGRHPWGVAHMSDRGYAAFRFDPDYLLRALKLTGPANELLKRCFHANPLRRPTLTQLRDAINGIDVFLLPDVGPPPAAPLPALPALVQASASELLWAVAAPEANCAPPSPAPPTIEFSAFVVGSCSSFGSSPSAQGMPSSCSSASPSPDSGSDSSFLDTPFVHPAEAGAAPRVAIPDLSIGAPLVRAPVPAYPPRAYLAAFDSSSSSSKPPACGSTTPRAPLVKAPRPAYPAHWSPASPIITAVVCSPGAYRTLADSGRPTLPTRRRLVRAVDGALSTEERWGVESRSRL